METERTTSTVQKRLQHCTFHTRYGECSRGQCARYTFLLHVVYWSTWKTLRSCNCDSGRFYSQCSPAFIYQKRLTGNPSSCGAQDRFDWWVRESCALIKLLDICILYCTVLYCTVPGLLSSRNAEWARVHHTRPQCVVNPLLAPFQLH